MSGVFKTLVPENSVASRPERMVGRAGQQEAIQQAIQDSVRIIYVEGGAGIGKTRLLDEVDHFIGGISASPIVLEVVDFYDTTMHGSLALEERLARQMWQIRPISEIETFFAMLERHRVGTAEESEVHSAFTQAFNAWVGEDWAILRFDTAEFLEYGQDAPEVLKECEVHGEEVPALKWLWHHLPKLERMTALIAARPTRTLRQQLESAYSRDSWKYIPLDPLGLEATRQYFRTSEYGREIDEMMVERMWLLTDGRPILLSLAIDWLARGVRVDEIYDADIQELHRLRDQRSEEWLEIRRRFERALVNKVRKLDTPMDAAVYYAARARKGFTAEILHRMLEEVSVWKVGLTEQEIGMLMARLANLSFVKRPHGARPGWFFLHDEMYDLMDRHVWQPDYPGYTHQRDVAEFLAEQIYGPVDGDGLLAQAAEQIKEAETHAKLLEERQKLNALYTERLFYLLEADPKDGYQAYERLSAQAISQQNREWDDMLRIEVLRFMRILPERARHGGLVARLGETKDEEPVIADFVNQGCRIRWVFRFSAREQHAKADSVAHNLLNLHPDGSVLWRAGVLVGRGAALQRLGHPDTAPVLQQAISMLETLDPEQNPWAIRFYLATAYLYLGLRSRAERNVKQAAELYGRSRDFFDEFDPVEAARASNNLAYVAMWQGKYTDAVQVAQDTVKRRRELGDAVGLALSLNTWAIVEDRRGDHLQAWTQAQKAFRILQRLRQLGNPGLEREIAMIYLNLGRIGRHRVEREGSLSQTEGESRWQQAEEFLQEAEKREPVLEPYYRIDLYNQFGLLYTRWANWMAAREHEKRELYRSLMQQADKFCAQADQLSKTVGDMISRADNLEDWAWIFHLRRSHIEAMGDEEDPASLEKKVLERLQEAERLVREGIDPNETGLQFQYIGGCVHHQWGRYLHKFLPESATIDDVLRHYALSVVYYDQFSSEPLERRNRVLEHLMNTLVGQPAMEMRRLADHMLSAVEERRLPTRGLRVLIDDMVMG